MPFSRLRGEAGTLLGAQLVFNLGFYAVIPFLAGAMGDEYGLDAVAVGLVLGARTFSQQGMFLAGGLLADRWGARRAILLGCLVRISGYAVLAAASNFSLFLLGAMLTGAGGALFSPALESQLSRADHQTEGSRPAGGKKGRRSVFVWLSITGEIGALLGPVLGALLLGWGFDAALALGMGIFSAVTVLLWFRLPAHPPRKPSTIKDAGPEASARHRGALGCLRNRRFVLFCLLASTNMLAYNQLYFAVPVELGRRGLEASWLGGLFLMASVLTLVLQLPVSAAGQRLGPNRSFPVGFVLLAAAFVTAALTAGHAGSSGNSIVPLAGAIVFLILGHMLLTPTILSLIPKFLPEDGAAGGRGAYYGLAASCGGISVLLGNAVMGQLVDLTDRLHWWPGTPWLPPVLLAVLAALALPRVLPAESPRGGFRGRPQRMRRPGQPDGILPSVERLP